MKINFAKYNVVKYKDIESGHCFKTIGKDNLYIKTTHIDSTETSTAVNLVSGACRVFYPEEIVVPIEAEINIIKEGYGE